ncbi:hypothetical protein [Spirosoma utsteinense]|uniref:Methyl-accepting chemotaxis protein n=1 Tax=Spirosoma utsteinense TaxID=2585773 RepID=A0ABR6W569_9BACT|nr:hypothetical protein [Spirosoma utsteinense]MBC3785594.1 methyl-accepting chemotaxis protein [Spirosoma utsteinense]MBC3791744.1 methyl-accepting chemotaxis protein [Spirosoma utsteinense]
MFLEERVEQLENLAADQGRQTERVASGLAVLTIEVRAIRQDVTTGFNQVKQEFELVYQRFEQVDRRFEQVDQRFEQIDQRLEQMDRRFEQIDRRFEQVFVRFDEMQQTQLLILKLLTDKK